MQLQLRDIAMIKEADIKIDGLTVIAGENDTGKSSIGKALFLLLKARTFAKNQQNSSFKEKIKWLEPKIFRQEVLKKSSQIELILENDLIKYSFLEQSVGEIKFLEAIFIESPIILNYYQTFRAISNANSILDFKIPYSYLSWDVYIKLAQKSKSEYEISKRDSLIEFIKEIIDGDFIYKDEMANERWVFVRDSKEFEMDNTATGIKQFGLLLSIFKNGYLTENRILILDELEVHLHPKWQLEMAKVIIKLVKSGVKVLVTSHSPYMIEALEIFSKKEKINSTFYLAKKEKNFSKIEDVTKNTGAIYELLAEPFDVLEDKEVDSIKW